MVGGEHREHALLQALPACLLARLVARRRRADVLRALHVEAFHVLRGEHEILRAGLAVDLQAALLRAADLLHRLAVRDVHDHDRHVDQLGERDRAVRRLALDRDRPRRGVEMRRGLAGALQPVGQEADRVVVLRMHHHERAGLARDAHHVEHLQVGQRHALIGHEHLERGVAVLDQRRQFLAEHAVGRVRDDEVERDVDVAIAVGLGVIVLHDLRAATRPSAAWRTAAPSCCRRTPPSACRSRNRPPSRCRGRTAATRCTWLSMPPGSTSMPVASTISAAVAEIVAERRDAAVLDADIAGERVGRGRDRSAANDRVECHDCPSSPVCASGTVRKPVYRGEGRRRQQRRVAMVRTPRRLRAGPIGGSRAIRLRWRRSGSGCAARLTCGRSGSRRRSARPVRPRAASAPRTAARPDRPNARGRLRRAEQEALQLAIALLRAGNANCS